MCDGPPDMNNQITRLALGAKCKPGNAPCEPPSAADSRPGFITDANAAVPIPALIRPKK